MKVIIGPYKSWIGPYQIADALCFWAKPVKDECGFDSKPQWVHDFGTWLSGGEHGESWLLKLCQWIESKRTRQVYVRIDKYDTWSMDHTLGYLILPMLKQLKATKHGSPIVDLQDVPEHLRGTNTPDYDAQLTFDFYAEIEQEADLDYELLHKRWDWVLDEMIWAFEQQADDSEAQFYDHGTKVAGESLEDSISRIKVDYEGLQKWQARKANGYRLFGKYYEALWD